MPWEHGTWKWHDGGKDDWPIVFEAPPDGVFEISLTCLHSLDTANVFAAGRCTDGEKAASSAVRVMGTALATGQAAGCAAALIAATGRDLLPEEVQRVLKYHGAFVDKHNLPETIYVDEPAGRNPSVKNP